MRVNKNYWIPKTKIQLVEWLGMRFSAHWPKFKRMNKKQLYAIYFSIRDKMERAVQP